MIDLKKVTNLPVFNLNEDNIYTNNEFVLTDIPLLNVILGNGSMSSGFMLGRRYMFAGKPSTAKSLFIMYILKEALNKLENCHIIFFESEGSTLHEMAELVEIDKSKMSIIPVSTVEEFKTESLIILNAIEGERKKSLKNKTNYIFALDSLGMLGTSKENADAKDRKSTQDMTRAKVIKSIFRIITLKLFITKTTLFIVNHTYADQGMFSSGDIVGGGDGAQFASDIIIILSKKKEKIGTNRVGSIFTMKLRKSRYQPEDNKVQITILNKTGIYKYSGLFELGLESNLIRGKKKYKLFDWDGNEIFEECFTKKEIIKYPEKFFTETFLEDLDKYIKDKYSFSSKYDQRVIDEFLSEDEDEEDENEE